MKKYDLFHSDDSIIRVLDIQDDRILMIDCIKHSMSVWVDIESLKSGMLKCESTQSELLESGTLESYSQCSGKEVSVCTDDELFEAVGFTSVDIDTLDADQRKVMYERYTMITPILPFIADDKMRSKLICSIAEEHKVSKQTVRNYLCLYLSYLDVTILAPKKRKSERELTHDEKHMRWALNKFFYTTKKQSLNDEVVFENDPMVFQYAEYLDVVFDAQLDFENDIPISSILYDGMSRTKYLKRSGRSRYTKMLADDMSEFYKNMGICSIASVYQIQRVLLGSLFEFSAICQIAFFLGMKPEELTAPSLTAEQIKQEQNSHYMRNIAPVDWDLLDRETAPVLEKFAKSVYDGTANENGRPERVSERLVYREINL